MEQQIADIQRNSVFRPIQPAETPMAPRVPYGSSVARQTKATPVPDRATVAERTTEQVSSDYQPPPRRQEITDRLPPVLAGDTNVLTKVVGVAATPQTRMPSDHAPLDTVTTSAETIQRNTAPRISSAATRQQYLPTDATGVTSPDPPAIVIDPQCVEHIVKLVAKEVSSKGTTAGNGDDDNSSQYNRPAQTTVAGDTTATGTTERGAVPHSVLHRRPSVKLGIFDGSGNWNTFLMRLKTCAVFNEWGEQEKLMYLM